MRKFIVLMLVLSISALRGEEKPSLVTTEDSKITLQMDNAPIGSVLKLLAAQNNLNIVSGPEVKGNVSLNLTGVSLDEALSAVLLSSGFTYSRQGNVIVVVPGDKDYPQQLETKVFELAYVSADYVMASLKNVLSPKGKADVFSKEVRKLEAAKQPPATILVVTDLAYNIPRIERIIEALDKPVKQVSIEVRGQRREEEPRRYVAVHYRYQISGEGLDQGKAERAVSLSLEKYCSVVSSLAPDIKVTHEVVLA